MKKSETSFVAGSRRVSLPDPAQAHRKLNAEESTTPEGVGSDGWPSDGAPQRISQTQIKVSHSGAQFSSNRLCDRAKFNAPPPTRNPTVDYESLVGGSGREIYYRQARYSVADLLGTHTDIEHSVEFDSSHATLRDFGINGIAFSSEESSLEPDQPITDLRVVVGGDTMYRGRALVRYCRIDGDAKRTLGVVLLDGILDIDAMIMAGNRALTAKTAATLARSLGESVSRQYKQALADLTLILSTYRELMASREESLQSLSVPHARSYAEQDVLKVAIKDFAPLYGHYRSRCQELTQELESHKRQAYRFFTKAVLHPYVLSAPNVYHACRKPLGYPGDFMLMSYMYDPSSYGSALFDRLIHQTTNQEEPLALGVRQRKEFFRIQVESEIAKPRGSKQPCRIMSLACGPAQEIVDFVSNHNDVSPWTELTLIDQDQRSLTHVNSLLSKLLIPGSTNVAVKYLYLGFKQMITALDAFDALPQQDLIYAAGLFDYIKTSTARRLAQRLFRKLVPGGRLLIGNFRSPNDGTWSLEYWMDWRLLYRTRDDMLCIAEHIDEPHEVDVSSDSSTYTHILSVTRG